MQPAALRSGKRHSPATSISQKDIFISFDCVKHLVFPVQVSDIAIGEQELVMASRVEEAPHIVRLSAQAEAFTQETNLTVVCIDGSVYTYHIRYLPEGGTDSHPNIYEDNGKWQHHDYQAEVSDLHLAEFFFPEDIAYGTPGNEVSFTLAAYNNQLKVSTPKMPWHIPTCLWWIRHEHLPHHHQTGQYLRIHLQFR